MGISNIISDINYRIDLLTNAVKKATKYQYQIYELKQQELDTKYHECQMTKALQDISKQRYHINKILNTLKNECQ